jgi:hypothetical protein
MYRVEKYTSLYYNQWNSFVERSKNGTFLFHRDFMEYHSDRFEDFSLLVFESDKLVALLPANRVNTEVYSHQGLTYGGLIYNEKLKQAAVITVFKEILQFLNENGIDKVYIKQIPYIYHNQPSQELEYALFLVDAKLIRRDSLSVIDMHNRLPFAEIRKQGTKKGERNGLVIIEESQFELFWKEILIPNLQKKHGVDPVHTAQEMILLNKKFPHNIRHFNVYNGDKIVAGTTVFITDTVAHLQYISKNEDELGSLDFLYYHLITQTFAHKKYFDFGISNEEQGKKLNQGLAFWKESFGARSVVQDFYEVETASFTKFDNVLI